MCFMFGNLQRMKNLTYSANSVCPWGEVRWSLVCWRKTNSNTSLGNLVNRLASEAGHVSELLAQICCVLCLSAIVDFATGKYGKAMVIRSVPTCSLIKAGSEPFSIKEHPFLR